MCLANTLAKQKQLYARVVSQPFSKKKPVSKEHIIEKAIKSLLSTECPHKQVIDEEVQIKKDMKEAIHDPEFQWKKKMKDLDMRRSQIQKQYYNDKTQANEATENKLKDYGRDVRRY